jgi:hypothetical protein
MANNVLILKGSIIKTVTYVSNSLVVTDNKPGTVSIPNTPNSDYEWKITVDCPRDGSESVAEDFNLYCKTAVHEYAPKGGGVGEEPSELNFYLKIIITLATDNKEYEVAVGQGHYNLTNNWWIGGQVVHYDNDGATFADTVGLSGDSDTINFNTL